MQTREKDIGVRNVFVVTVQRYFNTGFQYWNLLNGKRDDDFFFKFEIHTGPICCLFPPGRSFSIEENNFLACMRSNPETIYWLIRKWKYGFAAWKSCNSRTIICGTYRYYCLRSSLAYLMKRPGYVSRNSGTSVS